MKNTTIVSNVRHCFITLTHSYSDSKLMDYQVLDEANVVEKNVFQPIGLLMSNRSWHMQIQSSMNIAERKYFDIQNNNYQTKHPSGSASPFHE